MECPLSLLPQRKVVIKLRKVPSVRINKDSPLAASEHALQFDFDAQSSTGIGPRLGVDSNIMAPPTSSFGADMDLNEPSSVPEPVARVASGSSAKEREVTDGMSIFDWTGKFHQGDCVQFLERMPKESVDLFVTSPPYNLRNSTGNGMKDGRGGKWATAALLDGYDQHTDAMPHGEYVEWQRNCLAAMMRVLKDDGAIFYNHKWRVQAGLLQDRADILQGFPVRQIIIWQREGGFNFNPGYFLPTYEVIYLICKPRFKLAPKGNAAGDIWRIPQGKGNPHPAPFPVQLAQRCIESTNAQIVCDPFMGSGTTAIAAESLGRQWIGIDTSSVYCELAGKRIIKEREKSL
jgi:site-specific DNA-methyltransferase (adenine-specific)